MLRITQIHFFFLTAQTAQAEEFMLQNVAYRPTVYRTGMTTDFVRFMKINSNRSEIQTLQNLCFEFQIVNLRKSDNFLKLFWVN